MSITERARAAAREVARSSAVRAALGAARQAARDASEEARRELRVLGEQVRRQIESGQGVEDDTANLKARLDAVRNRPE
jgi:hypothetical protein